MKRCMSLFLTFALILSLFAGLELKAEAATYLYNTGVRGEVCTSLSDYAKSYYTGSYTYGNLSTKTGSSLRSALYTLVNTNKKEYVYADLRTYLAYTDADYSNSNNLILFYCSQSAPSAWDSGTTWNREHVWPDSLGGSALEGDLHAMRPTDPKLNSTRNNNLYGETHTGKVATAGDINGNALGGYYGINFEPLDNAKGDCARIILYDYVAQTSADPISIVFESVDILLKWCALDPVDEFEMSRNDSAQSIQNNRNPFVDYPELAWLLMGREIPSGMTTPSGGTAASYTVSASTNNSSYGTVSVSGYTITAKPAEGYYASGYTVLSGTATVAQNGNIFTVTPETNCSIRINFKKKSTVTVSFNTGASPVTVYTGDSITLPEGPAVSGYYFMGWTESSLSPTTQRPTYYTAGQTYTPVSNVTLYALYSYIEGGSGTGWSLVTSDTQLFSGANLLMACNAKGVVAGAINSTYLSSVTQSFSSDLATIEIPASSALILTLGGQAGAWTLCNEDGQLLGATAVKKLAWDSGTTTWDIAISDGAATIGSTSSSYGRFLYNSSSPRFTTYDSNPTTSMLTPQLYMDCGGEMYYTTQTYVCAHSSMTFHAAVAATCTEAGSVAYYTCASCNSFFADATAQTPLTASQIVVVALGHDADSYAGDSDFHWQLCTRCGQQCTDSEPHAWDNGTVTLAPTETETGLTTYTCTVCSKTYTETIPALGAKFTVQFSVPTEIAPVAPLYGYAGETVTLPEAEAADGYTFLGWAAQSVSATTQVPNHYTDSYTISGNVTLYALYRYTEGGEGTGWVLVTSEDSLYSGASLVLAVGSKGKVASVMSGTYLSAVDQVFSSDLSAIEDMASDALILTLGGESGAWTFANSDGRVLGCTSLKAVAWNDGNLTWDITFDAGNAVIAPTENGLGRILYNSTYPRFTTYTSTTGTYMFLPQLYINTGSVTYYATQLVHCEHTALTFTDAVAPTCTQEGSEAYYTCNACGKLFADAQATMAVTPSQLVLDPLGHEAGAYAGDADSHWQICTRCTLQCTDKEDHTWDEGTTVLAPTETASGMMTYTCTVCKTTHNELIPALGAKLAVQFLVPVGVTYVEPLYGYAGESITLPTISGTPDKAYTFLGWTAQTVSNSTSAGTYYRAGESIVLSDNLTLKALFSHVVTNNNVTWNRLETTASLKAGSQVVLACSSSGTVAGAMSGQYLSSLSATFSSDKKQITTLPSGAQIMTLGGSTGAWTFANSAGQLLGATAQKKLAWGSGTTKWKITIASGVATITNGTSSYGSFAYNWLSPRFTTYSSASSLFSNTPDLYVRTGGSTTYYNTEFAGGFVEPELPAEPTVDETIAIYHTLNLTSDISITYAVPTNLLADYDSYTLECVLPIYEGNALVGERTVTIEPVLNGNYYYFVLTGITAMQMNNLITATMHMTKGDAAYLSKNDVYSVATYAYAQLDNNAAADKLKALCANLLRYGAAAQTYKGYRTDALVDSNMTDAHRAYLTDLDTVTFGNNNQNLSDLANPTILWVGKTLLLDSKVTLRYVINTENYTGKIEDLSLHIRYTNYKGEEKTAVVTNAQPYGATAGRYSFDFDGLLAAELRCALSAAVYAGDTRLSGTMIYSVDSYGSTASGTLGDLCKSMLAYSDVALAYFS